MAASTDDCAGMVVCVGKNATVSPMHSELVQLLDMNGVTSVMLLGWSNILNTSPLPHAVPMIPTHLVFHVEGLVFLVVPLAWHCSQMCH
jgi:hypothetical protein